MCSQGCSVRKDYMCRFEDSPKSNHPEKYTLIRRIAGMIRLRKVWRLRSTHVHVAMIRSQVISVSSSFRGDVEDLESKGSDGNRSDSCPGWDGRTGKNSWIQSIDFQNW